MADFDSELEVKNNLKKLRRREMGGFGNEVLKIQRIARLFLGKFC
ncbi:MAG: hypothetical protein Q9M94_07065 [Candidatus Gracilibacteria bacterium]|nr:hypothetical protein [Candidatus Gracilibacteria bacterium]